jgi:formylglycine-generating enzyme required for sulfatase activity
MARIEKTVFIGYRRKDISWALAVYQYLTASEYDVFFDYTSLSVGDFEKVIVGNIRARAHFVLLLTPSTLDKCNEPGDWLRREIETAIDEKRNIIPLFFEGFSFGAASVAERLTGKLEILNRYNGLDVPAGYFPEAMERLRNRYLNIPLKAVLHPIPAEVREKVKVEQAAANEALEQQKEIIRELLEHYNDKQSVKGTHESKRQAKWGFLFGGVLGLILSFVVGLFGYQNLVPNSPKDGSPIAFVTDNSGRTFASALPNITISTQHATTTFPSTSTPQYAIGSTRTSSRDGMILQYVPAGSFMMGADADDALAKCEEIWSVCERDWFLDVEPAHLVHLDAYWIDKTEVTTGKYQLCVEAGGCKEPGNKSSYTHDDYFGEREFEDFPMIQVDWNMANAYCEWVGRRLPTEAEWEKAARGESTWIFPWGDTFDGSLLNYCDKNCPLDWADQSFDDGYEDVAPVGNYPSDESIYGAQDMAGNVLEWVADWYDAYPGNNNENRNYGTIFRVFRGGSWGNNQIAAQLISRGYHAIAQPSSNIGFRCAMDAVP